MFLGAVCLWVLWAGGCGVFFLFSTFTQIDVGVFFEEGDEPVEGEGHVGEEAEDDEDEGADPADGGLEPGAEVVAVGAAEEEVVVVDAVEEEEAHGEGEPDGDDGAVEEGAFEG